MRRLAGSIVLVLFLLVPLVIAGEQPVGAALGDDVTIADASLDATTVETDIVSVNLLHDNEMFATGLTDTLAATLTIGGTIATPGSLMPMSGGITGARYMVLFNNVDRQFGGQQPVPGCLRTGGGRIYDVQGSWRDGFYDFLAIDARLTVSGWTYRPQIGWYDPAYSGSYRLVDVAAEPAMAGRYTLAVTPGSPSTLRVEIASVVEIQESLCVGGIFRRQYATTGDDITNVFGLTTAETAVAPPTTPGTPASDSGPEDRQAMVPAFSDWTNRSGAMGGGSVYLPGVTGIDTAGPTHSCWTETWGGDLPSNPFFWGGPARRATSTTTASAGQPTASSASPVTGSRSETIRCMTRNHEEWSSLARPSQSGHPQGVQTKVTNSAHGGPKLVHWRTQLEEEHAYPRRCDPCCARSRPRWRAGNRR